MPLYLFIVYNINCQNSLRLKSNNEKKVFCEWGIKDVLYKKPTWGEVVKTCTNTYFS